MAIQMTAIDDVHTYYFTDIGFQIKLSQSDNICVNNFIWDFHPGLYR